MKKVDSDFIFSRSLIFISLSFSLLFSQTSFTAEDIDKSHYGIDAVFAADMDNDGDMDIVTASYSDFTITWHENDGAADPTWTTVDIANDAEGAYCVFAADMDNDGDMDIVSASKRDDTIAWYENDGAADPTWTAADIATSANGAESVFAADMDNDGDMDIVSASSNDGTIAWYENDGAADPTWTAADIATSADGANSVFAADMDNDGDMDIVSSSKNDDTIAWYENDGAADPSFTAADITTSADGANSVFVADMDNDGDMDIVSANHGPSFSGDDDAIAWYENDGAADPSWTAADITTNVMDWPRSVFVADFDNDGDMDIVSAFDDNTYNKLVWLENDGAADPSWMLSEISTNVGPEQVFAADMDNDGDIDILGTSYSAGAISWYENNLPPTKTQTYTAADIATSATEAISVFAADMDGDGDMDIVSASVDDNTIAWYENDGAADPSFTAADIATSAEGAYSVFAADMDGDGDIDIVSASYADDTIAWYENDGAENPTFTAADIATSADGAASVFVADMDNDGDMDIVSASENDDTIAWYENDGAANPSWTAADIATSASGAASVFVADLDNDGDMDIVSASMDDNTIAWYEATFNNAPVITLVSDITVNEDESSTVTLSSTDADGDAITYSAVSDTNAVTVSVLSSTLTLTPTANWHGVATIKVSASDGKAMDSTSFKLTITPVSDIASIQDVTIDEDKSAELTLTSTFTGTTTFTAVSDTNAVTTSVSSSTLTLTPMANWHGVANIKAYASDGSSKDSTSFKLTVNPVQDVPTAFEWVSGALDTINITQSNLTDTYTIQWDASTDAADGDSIYYLLYAQIGVLEAEEIYDTTSTSVPITYQEFLENVFEPFPMLPRATVRFSISATDGIDTVRVTGDDRVLFVNRYEFLSIEGEGIPTEFALHENYPNPFNPTTTLRFDLPEVSDITLTIYNMLGQRVRTFNMQSTPAGYHSVTWDATNDLSQQVGAGVYLYQLQTKDFVKTRKMVLLKQYERYTVDK